MTKMATRGDDRDIRCPGEEDHEEALAASAPAPTGSSRPRAARISRASVLCIPHSNQACLSPAAEGNATFEIEYNEEECAITPQRLERARATMRFQDTRVSRLTTRERKTLLGGQKLIHDSLFALVEDAESESAPDGSSPAGGEHFGGRDLTAQRSAEEDLFLTVLAEEEEEQSSAPREELANAALAQDRAEDSNTRRRGLGTVKAQFMTAKFRSRLSEEDQGVLGVQSSRPVRSSVLSNKYAMYQMQQSFRNKGVDLSLGMDLDDVSEGDEEEAKAMDVEDISYVRKPNLARYVEEYEATLHHPKYSLKQVVLSRRFHLYAHRFANAQYKHCLNYPTLPQPKETNPWLMDFTNGMCGECKEEEEEPVTEKKRTRTKGHRFVIAADSQFGILMDGFAMENPNWSQEIEISRKCVKQINALRGEERPLYVCVCGDLVDTESSFSGAIASWKKVMSGWERNLVFEQQVKDFKRVWACLDPDIALVCLCGNHDVGNRPTRASIKHWTSAFGDDYLSFWVNGTYNICLNNCLFSNPAGAQDLFEEQLEWMEKQLVYARENDATHIFVYGHFPWFLKHEEEADDFLTSFSAAPPGWGPPGSRFADSYFTIPYENRKVAMALFKKYNVTACFSGHFHQNVVAQTSWGMPMIVTGPLSMNLNSEIGPELSKGEENGIGMRLVDVGERGEFTHKWVLLDEEEEIYKNALQRISRMNSKGKTGEEGDCDLEELLAVSSRNIAVSDSSVNLKMSESVARLARMSIDFDD